MTGIGETDMHHIDETSGPAHGEAEHSNAAQFRVVALCALVAFCDGLDTQSIAFVAPVITRDLNIEPSALGPVFSSGLVGLALGAFIFGPLADRLGRKAIIMACVALFAFGSLGTTWASDVTGLILWRVVTGLGLGGVLPNLISLTNQYASPRWRNALVMIMFCGFPLGATTGGLITPPLVDVAGWQGIFYLGGALPILLLPLLYFGLPNAAKADGASGEQDAAKGNQVAALFRDGRAIPTLLLWLTFFCNLLVMYLLVSWLPSLLALIGSSLSIATLSTALLNLGGVAGALGLSYLMVRMEPMRLLGVAYLTGAAALAVISMGSDNVPLLMIASTFAGAVIVGGQIAMNAITASYYPLHIKSTGVGWALGIGRIGSILGPILGGIMLSFGWEGMAVIKLAIVPTIVAAASVFALRRVLAKE
jgi:MFS transporter, AAHS family, 4-hydroxybenzoate transporter